MPLKVWSELPSGARQQADKDPIYLQSKVDTRGAKQLKASSPSHFFETTSTRQIPSHIFLPDPAGG